MQRARIWLYFALFSLFSTGCASTSSSLRARFARERGCPESEVLVRERGGALYVASGCGKTAEYACSSFTSKDDARTCEERNLARQAPAGEEPKPVDLKHPAPPK